MRSVSLRGRTVAATVAVVAGVLALSSAFVFGAIRTWLIADLEALLDERAGAAAEVALEHQPEELATALQRAGIRATVFLADGRRMDAAPPRPVTAGRLPARQEPPLAVQVVDFELPADAGEVHVAVARDGIDRVLKRLALLEGGAVLAGSLLAGGLAARASRRALRPLEDVIDVAQRTTGDTSDLRVRPERRDTEIGRLGAALDAMLDRLEAAMQAASAADERSRRFLADAAHHLRAPLTGAKASAEALLITSSDAVPQEGQLAASIATEITRAGDLVAQMLLLARLDRDPALVFEDTDLRALLLEEAERSLTLAPHVTIAVASGQPVIVQADQRMLRQLVGNLLDNARRHAQVRIDVDIDVDQDSVRLVVSDDGPGLRAGQEELVFERFVSLDGAGGTGLGLAIAREVVSAHGGTLHWDGTAFVATLALEPTAAEMPSQ